MLNQHTTGKSTCSLLVEYIFVQLLRVAVRHLVNYQRVVIYVLLLVGNHTSVALALGTLATEGQVELVTGNTVVQGDDVVVYTTVGLLVDIHVAYAYILMMRLLHAIEV